MELLVLGLVATIGFASYALWSRARASDEGPRQLPRATEERTAANLQVGDVLQHLGIDWMVEGVLTFSEEDTGPGARLCRLSDGGRERYLFVVGGELHLVDEATLSVDGPPSDSLEHDGRHYRVRRVVRALALRVGTVGERRAGGRVTLRVYAGAGTDRLILVEWSDHLDGFVGERVADHLFEVLPGK
jgi:hypothetical protein